MTASKDPTSSASSFRTLTLFAIALVGLVSLGLMGGVGYAKIRLDRTETLLAAPDSALTAGHEALQKTLSALGYGGYLGQAEAFVYRRDPALLADMKHNLNTADETVRRMNDTASAGLRHDLAGILALFHAIQMQAEQNPDSLTTHDLLPLAMALPVFDQRLQAAMAENKMATEAEMKNWSLILTLAAWGGLMTALILAAAFFIVVRGRQSVPLRALAESIEHISKGDLQTPVWGLERDDEIGALARTMDLARYRFSQVPDVTLMSDQGPVRLRFEGEARSLFEALMREIHDGYQSSFAGAASLTDSIAKQKDLLISLVGRLNAALNEIQHSSMGSENALRSMTQTISEAAKTHLETQQRALAQINKLVPYMQDRARGMADIATVTGEQVTQTLQRLSGVEGNLSSTAARSQKLMQDLSEGANQMSERLFGALNILQASGRALGETTEAAQTRFNEAVATLGHGEATLQRVLGKAEERLQKTVNAEQNMAALAARTESSAGQIEAVVGTIAEKNKMLSEQIDAAATRMGAIMASFDSAQRALGDAVQQIRHDGTQLSGLLQDLHTSNDQLLHSVNENSQTNYSSIQNLTERAQALLQRLDVQIAQQAQSVEGRIGDIAAQGGVMAQQIQTTTSALSQIVATLRLEQDKLTTSRTHLDSSLQTLGTHVAQQVAESFGRTEKLTLENHDKLATLLDQMDSITQRLGILGQLTGTLGAVAGQLGQLVPALPQNAPASAIPLMDSETPRLLTALRNDMQKAWDDVVAKIDAAPAADLDVAALADRLSDAIKDPWAAVMDKLEAIPAATEAAAPEENQAPLSDALREEITNQMHDMMLQIEAMNDQLAQMVVQQKDQLETRLIVMDKKLKATPDTPEMAPQPLALQQTAIMNEIVAALANLNDHVEDLDAAVETLQQDERNGSMSKEA